VQGIQEDFSGTYQLLVSVDALCGESVNVVKKNIGTVLNFRKEVVLELNAEKIK
jgi:hypothetical protein